MAKKQDNITKTLEFIKNHSSKCSRSFVLSYCINLDSDVFSAFKENTNLSEIVPFDIFINREDIEDLYRANETLIAISALELLKSQVDKSLELYNDWKEENSNSSRSKKRIAYCQSLTRKSNVDCSIKHAYDYFYDKCIKLFSENDVNKHISDRYGCASKIKVKDFSNFIQKLKDNDASKFDEIRYPSKLGNVFDTVDTTDWVDAFRIKIENFAQNILQELSCHKDECEENSKRILDKFDDITKECPVLLLKDDCHDNTIASNYLGKDDEIANKIKEIDKLHKNLSIEVNKSADLNNKVKADESKISDLNNKLKNQEKQIIDLKNELENLQHKIKFLNKENDSNLKRKQNEFKAYQEIISNKIKLEYDAYCQARNLKMTTVLGDNLRETLRRTFETLNKYGIETESYR